MMYHFKLFYNKLCITDQKWSLLKCKIIKTLVNKFYIVYLRGSADNLQLSMYVYVTQNI